MAYRIPGDERPAVQPHRLRAGQGEGGHHRQDRRQAHHGPHLHPQRRELARHGRGLGAVHVQQGPGSAHQCRTVRAKHRHYQGW